MNEQDNLVLFDVGGVLLELNYHAFYEAAASRSTHHTAESFREEYLARKLEVDALRGDLRACEYAERVREIIGAREFLSDEEIGTLVGKRWKRQIDEVVDLKKLLMDEGFSVGILSNIDELSYTLMKLKFPHIFEASPDAPQLYSYQHLSLKPEDLLYRLVRGYEHVTFIDDKPSYLAKGIESYGWNGILFTPYIDQSEAIRSIHYNTKLPAENFKQADSLQQLVESLALFGVR